MNAALSNPSSTTSQQVIQTPAQGASNQSSSVHQDADQDTSQAQSASTTSGDAAGKSTSVSVQPKDTPGKSSNSTQSNDLTHKGQSVSSVEDAALGNTVAAIVTPKASDPATAADSGAKPTGEDKKKPTSADSSAVKTAVPLLASGATLTPQGVAIAATSLAGQAQSAGQSAASLPAAQEGSKLVGALSGAASNTSKNIAVSVAAQVGRASGDTKTSAMQSVMASAQDSKAASKGDDVASSAKAQEASTASSSDSSHAADLDAANHSVALSAISDGKLDAKVDQKLMGVSSQANVASVGILHAGALDAHAVSGSGGALSATPAQPALNSAQPALTPAAVNPYARMDEASAPAVLRLTPQNMTVALHDPTLGNIQVQAQSVNGQIIASMATTNAIAHAQLSGHLGSLNGFLHEQNINVSQLTLSRQQLSSGMGGGQGSPQSGGGDGSARQQSSPQNFRAEDGVSQVKSLPSAQSSVRATVGAEARSTADSLSFSYIDLHA